MLNLIIMNEFDLFFALLHYLGISGTFQNAIRRNYPALTKSIIDNHRANQETISNIKVSTEIFNRYEVDPRNFMNRAFSWSIEPRINWNIVEELWWLVLEQYEALNYHQPKS